MAELETKKLNQWFDELLGQMPKPKSTKDKVRRVIEDLRIRDLLPRDVPVSEIESFSSDQGKLQDYWNDVAEGLKAVENSWDADYIEVEVARPKLTSKYLEREERRRDEIELLRDAIADKYDNGKGGYLKVNPYDDDVVRLSLLEGQYAAAPLEPTLGDAVESYVEKYAENKRTNENQRHHYIAQIRSISNKIASGLERGLETPLSELDRDEIKRIAEHTWPNANTRNTNLSGRMVPVITQWNRLNPRHRLDPNPFSSLVGDRELSQDTKKRRSTTPEELSVFWTNLQAPEVDPEIRIIGMMLAYAGCPQGETAGMLRGDLKLKTNVPYVVIRNNRIRLLAKKRLERRIPLVGPILGYWRDYLEHHFSGSNDAPLFPRFGQG
ncbi:MAG: hypothetical protein ACO22Z_05995, partial [Paracoccaceae bacterium]